MIESYGGSLVHRFVDSSRKKNFAESPEYSFLQIEIFSGETFKFPNLKSWTAAILKSDKDTEILVDGASEALKTRKYVQGENCPFAISARNGPATILLAGSRKTSETRSSFCFTSESDIKKVNKPWGFELWINGEHPNYSFKKIFIKTGFKTSLQYHVAKIETNVILHGRANFYYKSNNQAQNDDVQSADISCVPLDALSSIHIPVGSLHRIEAVTDLDLYEVSTPHLDDVIRVMDETSRPSGRINSEHEAS